MELFLTFYFLKQPINKKKLIQQVGTTTTITMSTTIKKALNIYFKGDSITCYYYENTLKRIILKTIFKLFNLFDNYSFDHLNKNYLFMDENGDVVVFDPSALPETTTLYLCFTDLLLGRVTTIIPWKWNRTWNNKHCKYELSSDGLQISYNGPSYENNGYNSSMPILISNKSFTSGKHEWTVVWRNGSSYFGTGLVHATRKNISKLKTFGNDFTSCPLFHKTCNMGERTVHVILDMDERKATINGIEHIGLPKKVHAGICFKMPHKMHATLLFE